MGDDLRVGTKKPTKEVEDESYNATWVAVGCERYVRVAAKYQKSYNAILAVENVVAKRLFALAPPI